jgi:ferritin-like protein
VDKTKEIIAELKRSYAGEFETLQNYVAYAIDLEGTVAETLGTSFEASIPQRLKNVRQLARRINVLGGRVPGSLELPRTDNHFQQAAEKADPLAVIHGVLRASEAAIAQYESIIALTEGNDYVTQDLVIDLLSQERDQKRLFANVLKDLGI